jgi:hypothetical protein
MSEHRHVYILEQKRIAILSLPSWLEIEDDQLFLSGDMTDIPNDCTPFMELGEIVDRKLKEYLIREGYDGVLETWEIVKVFEDEATAKVFAEITTHRYDDGYRVMKFKLYPTEEPES